MCYCTMASLLFMAAAASAAALAGRDYPTSDPLSACPGYSASHVKTTSSGLTAALTLAGEGCNVYGTDLKDLILEVSYDTDSRLHVKIQDAANDVYQVPEVYLPRPKSGGSNKHKSAFKFDYVKKPFSFSVSRSDSKEVIFDTSAASLIFESQYLRLRTKLPESPNLYGLGEHSDSFRLNTTDYIRTIWAQDAYGVPEGANLYGSHPVYYELRDSKAHGVFFLNSNGMDIKINNTPESGQYLEYNTLGGVLDFYFLAGPSMIKASQQYAEVVGLPTEMPYWGLGFHNCRYGYRDAFEVAEVVYNYSQAAIPLETMWTDIDYMYLRRTFSLDPERYSLASMRGLVDYLHDHDQHYIMMVDPNIAYQDFPGSLHRGLEENVFLLRDNGSVYKGVVWPGVAAFPDWFAENTTKFWVNEFSIFFDKDTGVDIDALWIDINEPANLNCNFPCDNPDESAIGFTPEPPPVRSPPRPLPGFPCEFQPEGCDGAETRSLEVIRDSKPPAFFPHLTRADAPAKGQRLGLPGRDLLYPKYAIHNKAANQDDWNSDKGGLSNRTVNTDVLHQNGLAEYDVHNLYGSMMSDTSYDAMLARRPTDRPLIITRSTFSGAGRKVGHWLGDNVATWEQYRLAMRSMMTFASMYQVPMVGADVCGFVNNTTEQLCARWTALGAFASFYRVHNDFDFIPQELYRWPATTASAKKNIATRYRLLDYLYTAMHKQSVDGTPVMNPMMFLYPSDPNTAGLELQYFFGPGLLVAPVTEEDATSVDVYLPDDVFYDWYTHKRIEGAGKSITVKDQGWTDIPLFLRGGVVFPVRTEGAMTTKELRTKPFELIVAIGKDGKAAGELYHDDGISVQQKGTTEIRFSYTKGVLRVSGSFGYTGETIRLSKVTFLGLGKKEHGKCAVEVAGKTVEGDVDAEKDTVTVDVDRDLTSEFTIRVD
ncbi:glycoside hydrolase family 31 protein [Astrocystis sublimbata]|nr:glycoside hydrolase family 31 protein [Astrocystis sublimbata]